jgi:hypothetical protein
MIKVWEKDALVSASRRFGFATALRSGTAMTTSATFLGVSAKATVGRDRRPKYESCSSFRPASGRSLLQTLPF